MFLCRLPAVFLVCLFLLASFAFLACGGGSSNGGSGTTTGGTTSTSPPGGTTSTGSGTTGSSTGSGTGGSTGSGGTGSGSGSGTGGSGQQPAQVTFAQSNYKPSDVKGAVFDMAVLPDTPGNDLVVSGQDPGEHGEGGFISVFVNHGDGTFGANGKANVRYSTGPLPERIAIGDLNGDGRSDIVTADFGCGKDCPGGGVSIYYGQGGAVFSAGQSVNFAGTGVDVRPNSVAIGDFNGDGRNDIAVSSDNTTDFFVLLNQGNSWKVTRHSGPSFASSGPGVFTTVFSIAAGDINGDSKTDLALLARDDGPSGSQTKVIQLINVTPRNAADVSFMDSVVETGTALNLTLADIDGNGTADFLLPYGPAGCSSCFQGQGLTWIFNFPDGSRQRDGLHVDESGAQVSLRAAVGDLNGDGQNDIALILSGNNADVPDKVTYVLGKGNRTFTDRFDVSTGQGQGPRALVSGKLNADQLWDLATVNGLSDTINVLLAQPK